MRYGLLLFTSGIFCNLCLAQNTKPVKSGQNSWNYFKLKKKVIGVVLEHQPTPVLCGKVTTASNTIIVTVNSDTIRVLEMCNTNKLFSKLDKVEVDPDKILSFHINFIPSTRFDKKIKRTTYGTITKIN